MEANLNQNLVVILEPIPNSSFKDWTNCQTFWDILGHWDSKLLFLMKTQ